VKVVKDDKDIYIPQVPSNAEDHVKSAAYHLPWFEKCIQDSISKCGKSGSIIGGFKNSMFKDKGSTLSRLLVSCSYNIKMFLKSTSEVFRVLEGTGDDLMGLKGIKIEDRCPLIADTLQPNEEIDHGFSIDPHSEPKRPLPQYSNWFKQKIGHCIPDEQHEVCHI